jgi:hypothetical protein
MEGGFAMRAASTSARICRACWRQRLRTATFTGPRAAKGVLYRMGSSHRGAAPALPPTAAERAMHRAPSWNASWSALSDPARALAEFLQKKSKFARKKFRSEKEIF